MQKINPFLWFDGNAEEAMQFYTSVFKNAAIERIMRYGADGPGPEGSVMSGVFRIDGQRFMALNGGPQFSFTPAISFFVNCETQEEVDELWERLSEGGEKQRCGWVRDRFGVSWQVIPTVLGALLNEGNAEKRQSAMKAMLQMDKIDIKKLQEASEGAVAV